MEKICPKCKELKPLTEFYKDKTRGNGLECYCKNCSRKKSQQYHETHREHSKQYYENNRERETRRNRQWHKDNPEYRKQWNEANTEHVKQYCKNNKEKRAQQHKQWREANSEKLADYNREYECERIKNDPKYKLSTRVSTVIWNSLKGNKAGRHWESLVGYTLNDLKNHLEKLFQKGMNWNNYGSWHLDHKIPISVFNFSKPEHIDFQKCWALGNLQPMWAKENIVKGNRLDKPFQPSLAF